MMDKAKAKPGKDNCKKGMRYDPLFLMHCLQIRLKSSKTYRHLKANGILPLPSLETIRKLLSSTDCRFGLNELALQHIKEALEGLPEQDRYGSLIWDEIHIKKKLHFDSRKFEFDGLTDFGDETEEINVAPGLADHVLVFMFRPYKQSWVQTIACYATRGATPGHIISNLVIKITTALFNHSAIVRNTVCDGAGPNRTAMTMLIGKKAVKEGRTYFNHPMSDQIKVFCMSDVPHLMKTTRNQFLKYGKVQVFLMDRIHNESFI